MLRLRSITKHPAHRIAAKSLYRALLQQCRRVALPAPNRAGLENAVRWQFHLGRHSRLLQDSNLRFRAGYAALELLHKAGAGDAAALARIGRFSNRFVVGFYSFKSFLRQGRLAKKRCWNQQQIQLGTADSADSAAAAASHRRARTSIFTSFPRPRREDPRTGAVLVRRPPTMVNASGFPILRFRKPQPRPVSWLVRMNNERKSRRTHWNSVVASYYLPLAQMEDVWDKHLQTEIDRGQPAKQPKRAAAQSGPEPEQDENSWATEFKRQFRHSRRSIGRWNYDARERAQNLFKLVLQEREIAKLEQAELRGQVSKEDVEQRIAEYQWENNRARANALNRPRPF